MTAFVEFLKDLLLEGKVRLRGRPCAEVGERPAVLSLLAQAYADYRLDVAGPLLDFDAATALAAGELVWAACWFLVNRDEPPAALEQRLAMPGPPSTPAQHLSADLVLRYLPQLHRRARAWDPADRLTQLLAQTLRQWPLTGVLAEVEDEPLTPVDFGGHPGVLLLYAERLAQHRKPAWVPQGPALEYVEWVAHGQGKPATMRRSS